MRIIKRSAVLPKFKDPSSVMLEPRPPVFDSSPSSSSALETLAVIFFRKGILEFLNGLADHITFMFGSAPVEYKVPEQSLTCVLLGVCSTPVWVGFSVGRASFGLVGTGVGARESQGAVHEWLSFRRRPFGV
jgi:hypothetical protein